MSKQSATFGQHKNKARGLQYLYVIEKGLGFNIFNFQLSKDNESFTMGLKVWRSLMAKSSRLVAYSFLTGALMRLKRLWGIVKTLNLF